MIRRIITAFAEATHRMPSHRLCPALAGGLFVLMSVVSAPLASQRSTNATTDTTSLVLPAPDSALQAGLDRVLATQPFRSLAARGKLSVALVDLSQPGVIRYAALDDDRMRYAASLPKVAIMMGVFCEIDAGRLSYSPALRRKMERMIRNSDNPTSSELIELIGFEAIANCLRDPQYDLYDPDRQGGLWVGKDYGGDLGYWERDPISNISHGATARQVARFLVMMDRGELVSPWASAEMKTIMANPAIKHKFVLGLEERPNSRIFRKSGTWRNWHADAAIVERAGKKYVAVALLETSAKGTLRQLIVKLDDLIHRGR